MSYRIFIWRCLGCLILTLFVSCSKEEDAVEKVLNTVSVAEVSGLDPIYSNDRFSQRQIFRVFDGLLEYHYLKRPYVLTPNLAKAMPVVSKDGLTYTFEIKEGVFFQDDSSFPRGKGRELVAEDFVYSFKRLADPHLQGLGWWIFDGKIQGLNEWRTRNAKRKKSNYAEVISGIQAIGKHKLVIVLRRPFPQFLYTLAMPFTVAVPKEAIEKYKRDFSSHPVGTGPFIVEQFNGSSKIVYKKNPTFRDKKFPIESPHKTNKNHRVSDGGRSLPLVDKIVVHIISESHPRWLRFRKGEIDYIEIPKDQFPVLVNKDGELKKNPTELGFKLFSSPALDVTYIAFNHQIPLFKNILLRRAMSLAHNSKIANELFYKGKGHLAQSILPPGIDGHIKDYKNPYRKHDITKAKELLARAGFPGGKGLPPIVFDSIAETNSRQIAEFFSRSMGEIGIRIKINFNTWPELIRKVKSGLVQMYGMSWFADYPDAENFFQLLYGPNKSPGPNGANYDNTEFNKLFEIATRLQQGPERKILYEKLNRIVAEQVPWIFGIHRKKYYLGQKWLKNFRHMEFDWTRANYLNIDTKIKKTYRSKL